MRLSELQEIDNTLRPYQNNAKREVYHVWESMHSVLFQMPTGTGKTRLFSSIIRDTQRLAHEKKTRIGVLVLAHRIELIQQIDETLSYKYGIAHGIIKSGIEEEMDFPVQVASVQTIARRLDRWKQKGFSYIIIDEAHHAVASTYLAICKEFPEARILGVTATPCRLTGDALRKLFCALIVSQPVNRFIEQRYLSPYVYYSIKPDSFTQRELDNITHFNFEGDYAEVDMIRVCDTNRVRANIVSAYLKYAKGKKGIIYTINQAHNKHICEEFEQIGVKIKAIDSKTPTDERKNIVAQFKSGMIDIICNVNIFSEGFDCPDCEFIQLARPTCSLAMYLQQVGRGLRPHPNKEQAIILDNVGSYNKFGLPSANRQWRRHFEGKGQRVTQSSVSTGRYGISTPGIIKEGDEELTLIFSGTSLAIQNKEEYGMLLSILNTKEWFPLGAYALLDPYQGIFKTRQFTKAARLYNEYEDIDEWTDSIEDEIETCRMDPSNNLKTEELDWAEKHIHEIYKFYYEGKYGLCYILEGAKSLEANIDLYCAGKKKAEEIVTLLLPPEYDEINVPDDQDRSICKKDGKFGVLSGETLLPIVHFEYEQLEFQPNGLYLALKDGKVGLLDGSDVVIPFEYEQIEDLQVSFTEMLYMVSEDDHFNLLQFVSGVEKNHQNKVKPSEHLIGDFFIGKSLSKYGFVCDEQGLIKHWLGFEKVGLRKNKGKDQILLAFNHLAIPFDHEMNEDGDLIRDIPDSDQKFKDEFKLSKLFIVGSKGIKEFGGIESSSKVEVKSLTSAKPVVPEASVIAGDNNLVGYQQNGIEILKPEYEEVIKVGNQRLIVKKDGKIGLFEITKKGVRFICKPMFQDMKYISAQAYSVLLDDGEYVQLAESILINTIEMSGGYLIRNNNGDNMVLMYHSKTIGKFQEIRHLIGSFFIVKEHMLYGIIRCVGNEYEYYRRCNYKKIALGEDKRNVFLYKEGRPRFIPVFNLK